MPTKTSKNADTSYINKYKIYNKKHSIKLNDYNMWWWWQEELNRPTLEHESRDLPLIYATITTKKRKHTRITNKR